MVSSARLAALLLALSSQASTATSQPPSAPSASDLLRASIAYHDRGGVWAGGGFRLVLKENRGEAERSATLEIDPQRRSVYLRTEQDGRLVERSSREGQCRQRIDGSELFSLALMQRFSLTCERTLTLCERYAFLWGLPMELSDADTLRDAEALPGYFLGEPVFALQVKIGLPAANESGNFFFDRRSKALLGYQLLRDESAGEGEYARFEGEVREPGCDCLRFAYATPIEESASSEPTLC